MAIVALCCAVFLCVVHCCSVALPVVLCGLCSVLWRVLCGALICCAGVAAWCRPVPCSAAILALVGAWCCCLFWGVCSWVWLPSIVFWWRVLALVSLYRQCCRPPCCIVFWCVSVVSGCTQVLCAVVLCCRVVLLCQALLSCFLCHWLSFLVHYLKNLFKKGKENEISYF